MKSRILFTILFLYAFSAHAQNIFRTACQGKLTRLDSLLQNEDLNIQDNRGRSLLHWAVGCNQQEVFQFLVDKGININQEDNYQQLPLHMAIQYNNEVSFDALLELQANDSWIEKYGGTLLERAILNKRPLFVKKLLEYRVDLDITNKRGSSPLELAKRLKAEEIYALLLASGADEKAIRQFKLEGAYMGQKPPGMKSMLFAPNVVSTEESEFGSVFNAAGTEFYYGVDVNGKNEIRYSSMVDSAWSDPVVLLSHERYGYNDPFLSPEEDRLYFISNRAMDGLGEPKDIDIWYVQKEASGWSEPMNAGPNINSDRNEYYISFTENGTMYFSSNANAAEERKGDDYDIYYSRMVNGEFQVAVVLGDSVNTKAYEADVFISPDESYIIFCSTRENGYGQGDLYISFKLSDGQWSEAVNMGEEVNSSLYEYCPYVSADGKYLFYTSNQDIYWISTEVIASLKKARGGSGKE